MALYFFHQNFRQRSGLPGVVNAHESNTPFRHHAGFGGAVKLKLENDGLFFEFLDGSVHFQQVAIAGGNRKTAVSSYFGHTELFLLVTKKSFRGNVQMAQKLLNAFMKIPEIADEIGNTIGVGIAETNPHFGFVG